MNFECLTAANIRIIPEITKEFVENHSFYLKSAPKCCSFTFILYSPSSHSCRCLFCPKEICQRMPQPRDIGIRAVGNGDDRPQWSSPCGRQCQRCSTLHALLSTTRSSSVRQAIHNQCYPVQAVHVELSVQQVRDGRWAGRIPLVKWTSHPRLIYVAT